jgi:hypothetical protein
MVDEVRSGDVPRGCHLRLAGSRSSLSRWQAIPCNDADGSTVQRVKRRDYGEYRPAWLTANALWFEPDTSILLVAGALMQLRSLRLAFALITTGSKGETMASTILNGPQQTRGGTNRILASCFWPEL